MEHHVDIIAWWCDVDDIVSLSMVSTNTRSCLLGREFVVAYYNKMLTILTSTDIISFQRMHSVLCVVIRCPLACLVCAIDRCYMTKRTKRYIPFVIDYLEIGVKYSRTDIMVHPCDLYGEISSLFPYGTQPRIEWLFSTACVNDDRRTLTYLFRLFGYSYYTPTVLCDIARAKNLSLLRWLWTECINERDKWTLSIKHGTITYVCTEGGEDMTLCLLQMNRDFEITVIALDVALTNNYTRVITYITQALITKDQCLELLSYKRIEEKARIYVEEHMETIPLLPPNKTGESHPYMAPNMKWRSDGGFVLHIEEDGKIFVVGVADSCNTPARPLTREQAVIARSKGYLF